MLRLLRRFDHGRLVKVALVVNIELAEGVLQPEDLALLELGVFPACDVWLATMEPDGGAWKTRKHLLLQLDDIHGGGSRWVCGEMASEGSRNSCGKVSAWLSLDRCCAFDGIVHLFGLP